MTDSANHRFTSPRPWLWWYKRFESHVVKRNDSFGNEIGKRLSVTTQAPGYNTSTGNLDEIAYACALCQVPLYFNRMRFIPDDLCQKCYAAYGGTRGEDGRYDPWLQFLITREQSRRRRLLRLRKAGVDYLTISYEEYLSGPEYLADEQVGQQEDE